TRTTARAAAPAATRTRTIGRGGPRSATTTGEPPSSPLRVPVGVGVLLGPDHRDPGLLVSRPVTGHHIPSGLHRQPPGDHPRARPRGDRAPPGGVVAPRQQRREPAPLHQAAPVLQQRPAHLPRGAPAPLPPPPPQVRRRLVQEAEPRPELPPLPAPHRL